MFFYKKCFCFQFFISRVKNKSISYWIELLDGYGVPCGKVNDIGESYMEPLIKQQVRQYTHPAYGSIEVPGLFDFLFYCLVFLLS